MKSLQGTPIKNVNISAYQLNKKIAEHFGEALFTHYGISGPAILDISKRLVECLPNGFIQIHIDFKPNRSTEELDSILLNQIKRHGGKAIKACLTIFVPEKLVTILLGQCNIELQKKASQVTSPERKRIRKQLKGLHLTLVRHRPIEEAIVTAGGVSLDEVDAKTMESTLMKRLYFAGEVLDIDGPTGGLISRQRSLRDTLLEILLIKMTFAFSLNIWYFSVLREEHRGLQRNLGFSNFLEGWLTPWGCI